MPGVALGLHTLSAFVLRLGLMAGVVIFYLIQSQDTCMSKQITSGYNYRGDFQLLVAAVRKAIEQMELKTEFFSATGTSVSCEVAEKMKWLTTNWPVKFSVEGTYANGASVLMVQASSTLPSITQEFSNQAKIQEFVELVKLYAPSQSSEAKPQADIDRIPCPRCGEMIAKTAKVCRFCQTEL